MRLCVVALLFALWSFKLPAEETLEISTLSELVDFFSVDDRLTCLLILDKPSVSGAHARRALTTFSSSLGDLNGTLRLGIVEVKPLSFSPTVEPKGSSANPSSKRASASDVDEEEGNFWGDYPIGEFVLNAWGVEETPRLRLWGHTPSLRRLSNFGNTRGLLSSLRKPFTDFGGGKWEDAAIAAFVRRGVRQMSPVARAGTIDELKAVYRKMISDDGVRGLVLVCPGAEGWAFGAGLDGGSLLALRVAPSTQLVPQGLVQMTAPPTSKKRNDNNVASLIEQYGDASGRAFVVRCLDSTTPSSFSVKTRSPTCEPPVFLSNSSSFREWVDALEDPKALLPSSVVRHAAYLAHAHALRNRRVFEIRRRAELMAALTDAPGNEASVLLIVVDPPERLFSAGLESPCALHIVRENLAFRSLFGGADDRAPGSERSNEKMMMLLAVSSARKVRVADPTATFDTLAEVCAFSPKSSGRFVAVDVAAWLRSFSRD